MRVFRTAAIFSNLAFIAYGTIEWLPPVLSLHLVLLPLNIVPLTEIGNCFSAGVRHLMLRHPRKSEGGRVRRREFIMLAGGAAAACRSLRARSSRRCHMIGYFSAGSLGRVRPCWKRYDGLALRSEVAFHR